MAEVLRPEQYTMKTANRSQDKEAYPFPWACMFLDNLVFLYTTIFFYVKHKNSIP